MLHISYHYQLLSYPVSLRHPVCSCSQHFRLDSGITVVITVYVTGDMLKKSQSFDTYFSGSSFRPTLPWSIVWASFLMVWKLSAGTLWCKDRIFSHSVYCHKFTYNKSLIWWTRWWLQCGLKSPDKKYCILYFFFACYMEKKNYLKACVYPLFVYR